MNMLVFGKNCGSFTDDDGVVIEYYKISGVMGVDYVEQVNDGVNLTIGSECGKFSVTKSVFELLPDDLESYDGGLLLDVDFNSKKKIVHADIV